MFIDELTLTLRAGNGGDGVVRWRHEKGKEFSGPSGGDGGRGGNVRILGVRDISYLARYANTKELSAERGEDGKRNSMEGKNGDDLILGLPVGSVVTNTETGERLELLHEGEEFLVLKGGRGGLGNEHFKGPTNQQPMESTPGKEAESGEFRIELELVVDGGFIGLPNAGKSSLLNALTNAHAKIGAYPFTTLDPNLGDLYGFILADIPGLIEGASSGKGLGHKFLRHIKRTKVLLHCISVEHEDVLAAYDTVRTELASYGEGLTDKKEIILLTKTDTVEPEKSETLKKEFEARGFAVFTVSILDDAALKTLSDGLVRILREESPSATILV